MSPSLQRDLGVAIAYLLVGLSVGAPLLAGGVSTYLDNPVHLAEIHALAHETSNGWSRMALAGFPLGGLHSPIGYGPLIAMERMGWSATFPYALCLLLAYLAPAFAVYAVGRRLGRPGVAALAGLVLLWQREVIVGVSSVWGGMWTFFIGMALLVLVIARLARDESPSLERFVTLAGLCGAIGLLHAFATLALVLAYVTHAVGLVVLRPPQGARHALSDVAAALVGGVASAAYWMPALMTRDHLLIGLPESPVWASLGALLLPVNLLPFFNGGGVFDDMTLFYTDALPIWMLWGAGVVGAFRLLRQRAGDEATRVGLYGAGFGSLVALLLLVGVPNLPFAVLGPVPWRMTYPIRLGFLLAAAAGLPALALVWNRQRLALLAVAALAGGLWFGRPLADRVPAHDGDEMAELQTLWGWIRDARDPSWMRIATQGTFSNAPRDRAFVQSHALTLTHRETGADTIGTYYGVAPFPSTIWARSESGSLFGLDPTGEDGARRVAAMMHLTATTHLVTADPALQQVFGPSSMFQPLVEIGRYTAWALHPAPTAWAEPRGPGVLPTLRTLEPGHIIIDVNSDAQRGGFVVRESYHPHWRVTVPAGVEPPTLGMEDRSGFLLLTDVAEGDYLVELSYEPPVLPVLLSSAGALTWLVLLLVVVRRRERS